MQILITDNIEQQLPMDYRKRLETDVQDFTTEHLVSPSWQIEACNIIRLVLEGQLTDSGFWSGLKTSSKDHLECILSVSVIHVTS